MVKPIDTAKMLDLLSTMHTKEAQLVERLRLAGIGETTIARAMHTSPQAIAKRFPSARTAVARTTRAVTARTTRATTAPRRATTPRKRAAATGRTRTRARARA